MSQSYKNELKFVPGGQVLLTERGSCFCWERSSFWRKVVVVLGREVHVEREVLLTENRVVWSAEGMFLGSFVGKVVA